MISYPAYGWHSHQSYRDTFCSAGYMACSSHKFAVEVQIGHRLVRAVTPYDYFAMAKILCETLSEAYGHLFLRLVIYNSISLQIYVVQPQQYGIVAQIVSTFTNILIGVLDVMTIWYIRNPCPSRLLVMPLSKYQLPASINQCLMRDINKTLNLLNWP